MKIGSRLAMILLLLVAALHLVRMALRVEIRVGEVVVPEWASLLGVIVPGALAILLWRERDGGGRR